MAIDNYSESLSPYYGCRCEQKFPNDEEQNHHHENVHPNSELALLFDDSTATISFSRENTSYITDEELKTEGSSTDNLDHQDRASEQHSVVDTHDNTTPPVGIPAPGPSHGESVSDINVPDSLGSSSSIPSMVSGTSQGSGESLTKVSEAPGGTSDETYPRKHRYSYYPGECEPRSLGGNPTDEDLMGAYRNEMLVDEGSDDDFGFDGTYGF